MAWDIVLLWVPIKLKLGILSTQKSHFVSEVLYGNPGMQAVSKRPLQLTYVHDGTHHVCR